MANPLVNINSNLGDNLRKESPGSFLPENLTTCRVKYIKLTREDTNFPPGLQNESSIGYIKFIPIEFDGEDIPSDSYKIARPLQADTAKYPLPGEIVQIHAVNNLTEDNSSSGVYYFYSSPLNVWDNINHNILPNGINSVGIKEKNVNPLTPKAGDIIHYGRFGQALKFGSDANGNPITVIKNGQKEDSYVGYKSEDINEDPSSIYILDGSKVKLDAASKNLQSLNLKLTTRPYMPSYSNSTDETLIDADGDIIAEQITLDKNPIPSDEPTTEENLVWDDAEYELDEVIREFLPEQDWDNDLEENESKAPVNWRNVTPGVGLDPQRLLANKQFLQKVDAVVNSFKVLGNSFSRNDLLKVMISESSLDPTRVNKQPPSEAGRDGYGRIVKPKGVPDSDDPFIRSAYRATGLIQFIPRTAVGLGTTTPQIYVMSAVEQLNYVKSYLWSYGQNGYLKSFCDLYMSIFFPAGLGKPDYHILGRESERKRIAMQNYGILKSIGKPNQPYITVGDCKRWFDKKNNSIVFPSYYENV